MDLLPALATASGGRLGDGLPPWSVAPFAVMLLCIAVLPLVAGHLWERNRNKAILSLALGLPVAIWMWRLDAAAVGHVAHEYVAFLLLLGSLFVIAGGIVDPGNARRDARPEHRPARHRRRPRVGGGDHRRLDAPHPPAAARQLGAPAEGPRGGLLHLRREQRRRAAHAAGRPAALPGIPAGRAVLLDAAAPAAVALRERAAARDLLRRRLDACSGARTSPRPGTSTRWRWRTRCRSTSRAR